MTPAEKQRRYRERVEKGILAARVDIGPEALEALIQSGALKEHDADDPGAVRTAVTVFLEKAVTTLRGTIMRHVISSTST